MGNHVHKVYPSKLPLLPFQRTEHEGLNTLVLDMDNTLICSSYHPPTAGSDFQVSIDDKRSLHVKKRPGLDKFLGDMSKIFEVVIFTSAPACYADQVIDRIDPGGHCVSHRLYVDSCTKLLERRVGEDVDEEDEDGFYVKDLHVLGRDLRHVVMVDDCGDNFSQNPRNGILIDYFEGSLTDRELDKLGLFLRKICTSQDVRHVLKRKIF